MSRNNIMFSEIRSQMGIKQLTISAMAETLECNRDTLGRQLSGKSPLNLDRAFEIQRKCFPEVPIESLFKELLGSKEREAS